MGLDISVAWAAAALALVQVSSSFLESRGTGIIQSHSVNLARQDSDSRAYAETVGPRKVFSGEIIKDSGTTLILSDGD
jgi:hypothetical protein